ncbi:metalloregulator ArsR/SmtB family transcription factor [Actinomycetospora sp. NBRC 106375]|uniref:ArsR/SmtB family transcription factor n=1 Tax=Actinomycetospora sp. NBRC 106375 TaxID=3032207 RepID=UPI0033250662
MTTDRLSSTFAALADPTRREILTLLARGEATVGEIAAQFTISLPAISRHLRVLEHAGLITRTRDAQWRRNRLQAEPFDAAISWMQERTRTWHDRLDRLDAHLHRRGPDGPGPDTPAPDTPASCTPASDTPTPDTPAPDRAGDHDERTH